MTEISKDRIPLFNRLFQIENNWHDILYVHTPFCVQKCYYCVYSSKKYSGPEELDRFYHQVLPQQIERLRPILEGIAFEQVYFGGGTPSIADAGTLAKTFERIPGFKDIPVKLTEAAPFTITDDHLELYHQYGFKFVSMGVQSLSPQILEAQNRRYVDEETLIRFCSVLEQYDIISNIDLIFYLETGRLEDLEQNRKELGEVMSWIRPASITIHSNYLAKKSVEKQLAMIRLLREILEEYPEYQCTNALLEETEAEVDMNYAAEYRLMRKEKDFHFYMTPKLPESHRYGHNMVALGTYEKFKPRYNYYYIYDYMDKYSFKTLTKKYKFLYTEFEETRSKLGLPADKYITAGQFFKSEEGREKFKEIIRESQLPYYEL
ncbi:MAG: radical SAM protein [Candidatus Aminicenantes bacterium]|nr:radical SAM protein [Candidatus Aminicenantes bacterium]NIM79674.1 radical SAM protein [Candidatus Aminicenantes bacterium]NIN19000.1 radical SAM protein [Candidatus Aminicenantes bacterium]NIN42902.1 radical SAM protein [Candidatus Aminicenantes bacterium]NIN85639.1 radical SAM protein [Candidatus Aminicenantes bacterium]